MWSDPYPHPPKKAHPSSVSEQRWTGEVLPYNYLNNMWICLKSSSCISHWSSVADSPILCCPRTWRISTIEMAAAVSYGPRAGSRTWCPQWISLDLCPLLSGRRAEGAHVGFCKGCGSRVCLCLWPPPGLLDCPPPSSSFPMPPPSASCNAGWWQHSLPPTTYCHPSCAEVQQQMVLCQHLYCLASTSIKVPYHTFFNIWCWWYERTTGYEVSLSGPKEAILRTPTWKEVEPLNSEGSPSK